MRVLLAGLVALAALAGAAVTFLWQGIQWLQNEHWTALSVATALRWLDARAWKSLVRVAPEAYAVLNAVPLSLALLGLGVVAFAIARWGAGR
ncbi:MAG TPA: hypothetical protein VFV84_13260 [Burkholderiales bacterium]|nr:hypothetical protein [Burkholderiales bacterium]